jgi:hypothetical protein
MPVRLPVELMPLEADRPQPFVGDVFLTVG